ncbi:universal stress protein [Halodesulfovibrio marinisediminis]|uniref:Nucleotide-binding universal stress protein, UspA family n=1 Tax=Halodesulfovibrio marinisediminis DSM 17456 TaxID=1121457 RepID=A0A1N6DD68_9BACT|nr:universal stress protein [Halodesulfovibrio marinisediminis]SIN68594.1 Nucleotide-binding universal stress protein, UspA family [Halodesulfovibrio marinisediminis DSM 17456]
MKELRILVAYDASQSAREALTYCRELMELISGRCEGKYTIMVLTVEQLPACSLYATTSLWKDECTKEHEKQLKLHNKIVKELEQSELDPACVKNKFVTLDERDEPLEDTERKRLIAKNILKEQRQGHYNTLVIGRRGMTRSDAYLFGSVSQYILQEARNCVIWLLCR